MSSKIIADVSKDVKRKLEDIAHENRDSMKGVIVRLVEKEYDKVFNEK